MNNVSYLLGHPVGHSKSPAMYNAVYVRLGLPWRYDVADLADEKDAQNFLGAQDFQSVNITTPYKPHAFAAATHKAASAKLAKGANLLVNHKNGLLAYNTDGQGCVAYLERAGFDFTGSSIVVCGTGPTALAILHACAIAGAREVVLVGRDKERTKRVLEAYVEQFGIFATATIDMPPAQPHHRSFGEAYREAAFKFGTYVTSTQAIGAADLVIQATPLGMKAGDPAPFDTDLLGSQQWAFDVVYGHGETAFLAGARSAGCSAFDGSGMLVAQAVVAVQIVTDLSEVEVDLAAVDLFDVMAKAAGFTC